MTLTSGTRLGRYEIVSPLGAGGMGEVYRARDTRLDRTVAIKVLPPHLSTSPELRQRFEREAKAISALNHPHICSLHDVGHQEGVDYLVMEYLEGETLAERLKKGAPPLEQVLRCGIEIAGALDKAHRQGVIHRDLKPGNVMLTKAGAKLLDFGLAKLKGAESKPSASELSVLPTAEKPITEEGTILGTYPYMAPEQLEGKEADARTDIFAFGAVLYEMATGKRAFTGRSKASLIAAILEHEPVPISTLQPMVPAALDRLVRTCLAKDPDERWQTAHDVLLELKGIGEAGAQPGMATALRPRPRERLAWSLATFAVLIAAIATTVALSLRERGSPRVLRFSVLLPKEVGSVLESAISPDGRRLAFTARHPDGKRLLWIRPIDSLAAQPLAGTEGAMLPFWSPDSRLLGFFAEDKLKKIEASGGSVQTVCEAVLGRGGTWSREGTIVFGGRSAGGDEVLHRVSEAGGAATALTQLDRAHHESIHLFPSFLPDGDHFVYFVDSDRLEDHAVKMGSLRSGKTTRLLDVISNAAYAPPGYLLYSREGTLLAQRLDTRSMQLVGEAFPLGAAVAVGGGVRRDFSVSAEGTLAYTIGTPERRLIWVDRSGRPVGTAGEPGYYVHVELSPDDARAALERLDSPGGISDVWVFDFSRGTSSRFTFDPGFDFNPVWSPDGGRIAFASNRAGAYHLYQRASAGGPEERLLESSAVLYATQWSPDGRFIVYEAFDPSVRGVRSEDERGSMGLAGDWRPQADGLLRHGVQRGSGPALSRWAMDGVPLERIGPGRDLRPAVSAHRREVAGLERRRPATLAAGRKGALLRGAGFQPHGREHRSGPHVSGRRSQGPLRESSRSHRHQVSVCHCTGRPAFPPADRGAEEPGHHRRDQLDGTAQAMTTEGS